MIRAKDETTWILKKLSMLNTNILRVTNRLHEVRIKGFERMITLKVIQEQKDYLKGLL